MNTLPFLATLAAATSLLAAQDANADTAALLARVRAGGWFEQSQWKRAADGALQILDTATSGGATAEFRTLLGDDLSRGLMNGGAIGWLTLWCHGPDDLLAMTDADFHFAALGIGTSNVELRQYLARVEPLAEGGLGRAQLLDRMLAIDTLRRRGCTAAVAEFTGISKQAALPQELRDRAANAAAQLSGKPATLVRHRLAADEIELPAKYDACIVTDHSRLPDLGWLTALGRRLGALVTAWEIGAAGGSLSAAQANGAQQLCDVVSELPFGFVHRCGNARFDHSLVTVVHDQRGRRGHDDGPPVLVWFDAAGAFDAQQWTEFEVSDAARENNPLLHGKARVRTDRVSAGPEEPRTKAPAAVSANLLRDTGAAIRAFVAESSVVWNTLAGVGLPGGKGAEVEITFGALGLVKARIATADGAAAQQWAKRLSALLAMAKPIVHEKLRDLQARDPAIQSLVRYAFDVQIAPDDAGVTILAELPALPRQSLFALAELLVPR